MTTAESRHKQARDREMKRFARDLFHIRLGIYLEKRIGITAGQLLELERAAGLTAR